jgi:hypothetical protein
MRHGVCVFGLIDMCDRVQAECCELRLLPAALRPPDAGAVGRFNLDPLRVAYRPEGTVKVFGVHNLIQFLS